MRGGDGDIARPLVLAILDGWGYRESREYNAIAEASTPVWDRLMRDYPHSLLRTYGSYVGLPDGQMGNSEVGHMNIGAGRVVLQDLPRIDDAIKCGDIAAGNALLGQTIAVLRQTGGSVHLLGLLSDGGVHSHISHIVELARVFSSAGVRVWVHAFLDGRDVPPRSAERYISWFEEEFSGSDLVNIATVSGRYYAMDRDKRWDRVEKCYKAVVHACGVDGRLYDTALEGLRASYAADVSDEFVQPFVLSGYAGIGMRDGDAAVMCNFRADRAREILHALVDTGFEGFPRSYVDSSVSPVRCYSNPALVKVIGLTEYSKELNRWVGAMFPSELPKNTLGEIMEREGMKQLRIAETEKYAHVTFFFNGGRESAYTGEDRILVPSPDVATYDLKPEMSAYEVTDRLVEAVRSGKYDFIVVNYANTDMVGHTGDMEAAKKAVEAVDSCLGRLVDAVMAAGGAMVVTADHGNAELMRDMDTGAPHTAHTVGEVPFVVVADDYIVGRDVVLRDGSLCDIAPTLLDMLGLEKPDEMTGVSLIGRRS